MTLLNESRAVDLQLKWAELMVESAQLQCDIAVSKYNSEVFTESENEYILMEAEDAVNKSKGAIRSAVDKVVGFIKSVASKIASAFSRKKVQNDLDEIKSASASDPKVNGLKAQIPDYKQREKDIAEYEKAIQTAKMNAKKNGKVSEQDITNMENAKKKCSAKVPLITVGVVSSAAAVGALLLNANKRTDKLLEDTKNLNADYSNKTADLIDRDDELSKKHKDIMFTRDKLTSRNMDNKDLNSREDAQNRIDRVSSKKLDEINRSQSEVRLSKLELDLNTYKTKQELMYGNVFRMLVTALADYKTDKASGRKANFLDSAIGTVQQANDTRKKIKEKSAEIDSMKKTNQYLH